MQNIVIYMPGRSLVRSLAETLEYIGNFRVFITEETDSRRLAGFCKENHASVLLMSVSNTKGYFLKELIPACKTMRRLLPECKLVLLVDEMNYAEDAEEIKNQKKLGAIDGFFFMSGRIEYLSAILEAL